MDGDTKVEVTPPANTKITVNGITYDLADSFPITLADWEALEALQVMQPDGRITFGSASKVINTLWHFLKKINPNVTREELVTVRMRDLPSMARILELLVDREEKASKNPTGTGSST